MEDVGLFRIPKVRLVTRSFWFEEPVLWDDHWTEVLKKICIWKNFSFDGFDVIFPKILVKERPILAQIRGPKDLSASRIYTILLGILHWGSTCTKTPEEQSGGLCFRGNWRWSPNGAAYDVKWHFPVCVLVYYIMFRFHACIYIYIYTHVCSLTRMPVFERKITCLECTCPMSVFIFPL